MESSHARWLVLLLFCLAAASNAFMFMSMASIATIAEDFYHVGPAAVNGVAQALYAGYVLFVPVVMAVSRKLGLRGTVVAAGLLNAAGAVVRALPSKHLEWVTWGSAFAGVGLALMLGLPTWISGTWFPEKERATATATAALATQAGLAIGYLVPPLAVDKDGEALPWLHVWTAASCALVAMMIVALFRKEPQAAVIPTLDLRTLRLVCSTKLLMAAFQFGVATSIYWTLAVVLSEALADTNKYSASAVGTIGSVYLFLGIAGMSGAGIVLDRFRTPPFKRFITVCLALSSLLMGLFAWAVEQDDCFATTTVVSGALGLVLPALQPAYLELAAEYHYPDLPEEVSGSLLYLAAMLGGFTLPFLIEGLGVLTANISFTAALGTCTLGSVFLSSDLKRRAPMLDSGIEQSHSM